MTRTALRSFILTVLLMLSAVTATQAIPQFTVLTGNRCINCHVNDQGAGLRNELGWYSMNDVSVIPPASIGLGGMYEALPKSNLLLDEALNVGFDVRFQTARSIDSGSTRKYFPMQVAAHAAYTIADVVTLEGTYNFGPKRYPGQQSYSASVIVHPDPMWPRLRAGFFQPSIGVRYDDHSMMIRQIADNTAYAMPLIAPNYAEWGAEASWFGFQWLMVGAGIFGSNSLAQVQINGFSIIEESGPLYLARVGLNDAHELVPWLNLSAGISYFGQNDCSFINPNIGIGILDRLSLMGEMMIGEVEQGEIRNSMVALSGVVIDGLILEVRAEEARFESESPLPYENRVRQLVFGAQIFLLPYIELRPDYRIIDTEQTPRTEPQYTANRWNVQLHVFF